MRIFRPVCSRFGLMLCCSWLGSSAYAEVVSGPAPLPRLFFSPAERSQLERGQPLAGQDAQTVAPVSGESNGATLRLDGVVRRSDGSAVVFVNARPRVNPVAQTARAPVTLPDGRKVVLKVGQRYDALDGKVREGYSSAAPVAGVPAP
jgi:hypothetical protein